MYYVHFPTLDSWLGWEPGSTDQFLVKTQQKAYAYASPQIAKRAVSRFALVFPRAKNAPYTLVDATGEAVGEAVAYASEE